MIARIRGEIVEKGRDFLVVDVAGVGYQVFVSGATLAAASGPEIALRTHIHVREDALQLFGFLTADEQMTFERLLTVAGIGPRVALSFLTQFTPDELGAAVARRDAVAIARVKGVGKRIAERLVLELQGKLSPDSTTADRAAATTLSDSAADALAALGYGPAEIQAALGSIPLPTDAPEHERVRLALRALDRLRS